MGDWGLAEDREREMDADLYIHLHLSPVRVGVEEQKDLTRLGKADVEKLALKLARPLAVYLGKRLYDQDHHILHSREGTIH